jgi:hypothetical protein
LFKKFRIFKHKKRRKPVFFELPYVCFLLHDTSYIVEQPFIKLYFFDEQLLHAPGAGLHEAHPELTEPVKLFPTFNPKAENFFSIFLLPHLGQGTFTLLFLTSFSKL